MAASTKVKLTLASEIRLVDLAHQVSERLAEAAGLAEEQALNVGIAVREAVINAMKHGNTLDPGRRVDLTFSISARRMRANVRDQGKGFDPAAVPDPTDAEHLLSATGRGLLLIRAFMDRVEFVYREGRGMEIHMEKRVDSSRRSSQRRP